MPDSSDSIFRRYYADEPFVDRFLAEPEAAVDVIIPVIHSNELWESNLRSFYREIPIHRLLIGDGGCIDDTIEIVRKYPRVVVFDHQDCVSLGYSERKLIEAVETEWFVHTHSDVYLPDGWFDTMRKYQSKYDWFGCIERGTIMVVYDRDYGDRPWAGAQMGRKQACEVGLSQIDDDYIYRQGDFVYRLMIERAGFKEGRVTDTFHYHQTMYRPSQWFRRIKSVQVDLEMIPEEELRTWTMELRGTIKYLDPSVPWAVNEVEYSISRLLEMNKLDWREFKRWVAETNPDWLPYISKRRPFKERLRTFLSASYHLVFG